MKEYKWFIIILFILVLAACLSVEPIIIEVTQTPSGTQYSTVTITPIPSQTPIPTATQAPIGGSGVLVLEIYDIEYYPETESFEMFDEGIFQLVLADKRRTQIFPPGYHLEGNSPTEGKILVSHKNNLYSVKPDGSEEVLLSDFFSRHVNGEMKAAYWIPELNKIIFIGKEGNNPQLYIVDPDGTNLHQRSDQPNGVGSIAKEYSEGNVYWSVSGVYIEDHFTNLFTGETGLTDFYLSSTRISPNGLTIASYDPGGSYEPWEDEVYIRVVDSKTGEGIEGSLKQSFGVGEGFQQAFIEDMWWSPDNEQLLLRVVRCTPPIGCFYPEFYILPKHGASEMPPLPLPVTDVEILEEVSAEYISVEQVPDYFINTNPWSPDGRYLVFRSWSEIIIYDTQNMESTVIPGALLGGHDLDKGVWLSEGSHVVKRETPEMPLVYNSETQSYELSLTDKTDDIRVDYLDVVGITYSISGERLTAVFSLRDLPETLTFNQAGNCDGCMEYGWEVFIDVDNDLDTGGVAWVENFKTYGHDYSLEASYAKTAGAEEADLPLLGTLKGEVSQYTGENSRLLLDDYIVELKIDTDLNTILIAGDIPGISENSNIMFTTYRLIPNGPTYQDAPDHIQEDVILQEPG